MSRRPRSLPLLPAAADLIAAMAISPFLPIAVPVRWNLDLDPTATAPRLVAVFAPPIVLAALGLGMTASLNRAADPRSMSRIYFATLSMLAAAHLALLVGIASASPAGPAAVLAYAGIALIILGNWITTVGPNPWLGIRTPWTLADARVWYRTHRLAGPLLMLVGLSTVLASLSPSTLRAAPALLVLGLAAAVIASIAYSYRDARRTRQPGGAPTSTEHEQQE